MNVLFVHPNFPAQFGHIAHHLAANRGWTCAFVSETQPGRQTFESGGSLEKIQYKTAGGATRSNHFCTRTFENTVWHCDGVLRAMADRPDVKPDLIVGHSGFGSTLFLRELYPDVPVVNLFEYFYLGHDEQSDMTFRRDLAWPTEPEKFLRSRCRNAMILLDLQNCQVGYCPTPFQRSRFPDEYESKLRVCFDGIDTDVWNSRDDTLRKPLSDRPERELLGVKLPAGAKIVTYCARGFESMRGFDIFMKGVRQILDRDKDVHVFIAGTERIAYGGDEQHTGGKSFKQWTLDLPDVAGYDASRVHFLGRVDPRLLAELLATGDLHIYLTVPFVLSWSMINALACGATVLASDTAPVRDAIEDGKTGLLFDFFDPQALADRAIEVLSDPQAFRHLGHAAEQLVRDEYSLAVTLPRMLEMYEDAATITTGLESPRPRPRLAPLSKPTPPPSPGGSMNSWSTSSFKPSPNPFAG